MADGSAEAEMHSLAITHVQARAKRAMARSAHSSPWKTRGPHFRLPLALCYPMLLRSMGSSLLV